MEGQNEPRQPLALGDWEVDASTIDGIIAMLRRVRGVYGNIPVAQYVPLADSNQVEGGVLAVPLREATVLTNTRAAHIATGVIPRGPNAPANPNAVLVLNITEII